MQPTRRRNQDNGFESLSLLPRNWIDHSSKTKPSRSVVEDFNPDRYFEDGDRRSCFKMLINFDQRKRKARKSRVVDPGPLARQGSLQYSSQHPPDLTDSQISSLTLAPIRRKMSITDVLLTFPRFFFKQCNGLCCHLCQ